jgi:hypothetical protein
MTDHPCKGMTTAQVAAFEQIAVGNALPIAVRATMTKLMDRGLICEGGRKTLRDELGTYSIPQYFVPLATHIQWCEWCSEQSENLP